MNTFNLSAVLKKYNLTPEILAPVLFPKAKYPQQALSRVLKQEGTLDSEQLSILANYLGITMQDLFCAESFTAISEEGYLCFIKGEYKARLNYKGAYVSIYKDKKLIYQVIKPLNDMTVEAFINYLSNLIKKHENGKL